MSQKELLNIVFPDPEIRDNRVKLIASDFSYILSNKYHQYLHELSCKIEVARQKKESDEVLSLTKKSMVGRRAYLQNLGGTKSIFEDIRYYYSDYYGYNFPGKDHNEIRKIYENFWSLAEEAVPFINRREQILINVCKDNNETWLNSFYFAHSRHYSEFTCEVLLKLVKTDLNGNAERDDLGFSKSIDPWYAASVITAILYDQIGYLENYRLYYTLISDRFYGEDQCKNDINDAKNRLGEMVDYFPWIIQLLPENNASQSPNYKLIKDDKQFVSFLSGLKKYAKLNSWLHNLISLEKPYLQKTDVIYNNNGTINEKYLEECVMPKLNQLKTRIDEIPHDKEYEYELGRFLLDDATTDSCYVVLLNDFFNSLGIQEFKELSHQKILDGFVRSRQKCKVPVQLDEVITVLYETLNSLLNNERLLSRAPASSNSLGIELIKVFEDSFIKLDEATTTYGVKPYDYYLDPIEFIKMVYGREMFWGDATILGSYAFVMENGKETLVDKNYYFVVENTVLENGTRYAMKMAKGLVQEDLANIIIKKGVKPRAEDLVVKTMIDNNGKDDYILMYKGNNKTVSDNSNYYVFFDTETTGLPIDKKAPSSDVDNWPRLVQLSWIITDEKGVRIKEANRIIKPSDFIIPQSSEKLHGISTEKAMKIGRDINDVLTEFMYDIYNKVSFVVGHNVQFDKRVIGAELIRLGKRDSIDYKTDVDTMKISCQYCKIPSGRNNYYRYPTLQELYRTLFGVTFNNAHDAFSDVTATEKCFWELIRLGVFDIDKYFSPF